MDGGSSVGDVTAPSPTTVGQLRASGHVHRPLRVEIRDNLHARIAEARQQGWLGEVDGLQISLTGARQKLAQLDQIAAKPTSTHLGMPSFPQIAGRSVPPPETPA